MIQDVRLRFSDNREGIPIPLKVRDEHLHCAAWAVPTRRFDALGENARAPVGEVISVHRSDYHMLEFEIPNRLPKPTRFIVVYVCRFPFGDSTKHAPSRTDIAQNHESGCSMFPTFADVGATCLLTDGV
jgi:hypothetical protein